MGNSGSIIPVATFDFPQHFEKNIVFASARLLRYCFFLFFLCHLKTFYKRKQTIFTSVNT